MTSLSRVTQSQITMNAHQSAIHQAQDDIRLKNALLESGKQTMMVEIEEMKEFISDNQGKKMTSDNVDEFVLPDESDIVSGHLLKAIKKQWACEDTMAQLKTDFRKKRLEIDDYLQSVRELSEKQFNQICKINKILKS